jgi:flagellum-specific peptidoglycan hydrolase FlgJ
MLFRIQSNAFIVVVFCCFWHIGLANKKLTENYIYTYKNIAISEMKRTGIPASIKLAQGILESDLGRSPLANLANNHFGIKCGKDWGGEVFYKLDDDTDSTGTLIESCFRAFSSGAESYTAHSEFLTNPAKASRYGFLFDLASTDYVGWANGLKFAGYASDPSYPQKLIKIIENNKLYLFDENIQLEKREYAANDNSKEKQSKDKGPVKVTNDVNAASGTKAEKQIVNADQK